MNRSPLPTQIIPPSLAAESNFEFDWQGKTSQASQCRPQLAGVSHCLFAPVHYQQGYRYPLIVWLHGPTSNEQELRDVMPLVSVRNYVAVAPRGTNRVEDTPRAFGWEQTAGSSNEAIQRVRHCIATAQDRFNIHADRIFLAGYGEGGTMALRLGLEHPDEFAGVISLGGPMPTGGRPLKRIAEARKLPLLISVSPDQDRFTLERAMENVRLLHSAGSPLSLRLYPEGESLTTVMLSDVDKWIMQHVCPETVVSSS